MKLLIFTGIAFTLSTTFATEESRFKLLTSKCEVEANIVLDTSPQSPPLNVDDPATPGCNKWEINFLVNADVTQTENSTESKVGNSRVGLKYLFFEDEESHLDVNFYPQVEFLKADNNNPDSNSSTITTLPLLISKKLAATSLCVF